MLDDTCSVASSSSEFSFFEDLNDMDIATKHETLKILRENSMDFKDFLNEMKQERDESLRKNCQSFNDFDESTDSIVKLNDETEHQRSHLQLDIGSDLKFTDLPSSSEWSSMNWGYFNGSSNLRIGMDGSRVSRPRRKNNMKRMSAPIMARSKERLEASLEVNDFLDDIKSDRDETHRTRDETTHHCSDDDISSKSSLEESYRYLISEKNDLDNDENLRPRRGSLSGFRESWNRSSLRSTLNRSSHHRGSIWTNSSHHRRTSRGSYNWGKGILKKSSNIRIKRRKSTGSPKQQSKKNVRFMKIDWLSLLRRSSH